MKQVFLGSIFLLIAQFSSAAQVLKISPILESMTFKVQGQVILPRGQKLNKAAPSNITLLEKTNGSWQEVAKLKLNEVFSLTEEIPYSFSVQTQAKDSLLKMKASIYHCDKVDNSHCVIDDFEGDLPRTQTASAQNVILNLRGSSPKSESP